MWLALPGCFTDPIVRDGSPPGIGAFVLPLLGLFWLFGIGGGRAFSRSLIRVSVSPQGVAARQRWPPRR